MIDLSAQVRSLRREGVSWRLIAKKLGVTEYRCRVIHGGFEPVRRPGQENEQVPRDCLKCDRPFKAENRFIRVCSRCKQGRAWRDGGDYELLA